MCPFMVVYYEGFKINQLKKIIKNSSSIWNIFPNNLFNQLADNQFFHKCSFDVNKIPLGLCNFHNQALVTRRLSFNHNFSRSCLSE